MAQVVHAKIVDGGRLVVPAAMRRALGLSTGDTVVLELDGDELRLRSFRTALRRIQDEVARYVPDDGRSAVDELIAERRAEAAREEERYG